MEINPDADMDLGTVVKAPMKRSEAHVASGSKEGGRGSSKANVYGHSYVRSEETNAANALEADPECRRPVCHEIGLRRGNYGEEQVGVEGASEIDIDSEFTRFLRMFDRIDHEEVKRTHRDIANTILLMGGDSRNYRREREKQTRAIVSEIWSAPRVTAMARRRAKYGLDAGVALDLTTEDAQGRRWDFDDADTRDRAEALLDEQRPLLLIGSPMCTAFSRLLRISAAKRDPKVVAELREKAMVHLRFACKLYLKQIQRGCYFLHEHPQSADSWEEPCVQEVMSQGGVRRVITDQCQFGQQTEQGDPVRKPTGFMSNSPALLQTLEKRCTGRNGGCSRPSGGVHTPCLGKVARRAAIYHDDLCDAILKGFSKQMRFDRRMRDGEIGLNIAMYEGDDYVRENDRSKSEPRFDPRCGSDGSGVNSLSATDEPGGADYYHKTTKVRREAKPDEIGALAVGAKEFIDDLTGQALPPDLVRQGQRKELDYFEAKKVWVSVPRAEAKEKTGRPPISVRWVNTNKGDHANPNVRCRFVAREIRTPGQEAIFAPTPPLEALRTVLSCATTQFVGDRRKVWDPQSDERMQVSLVDISRAYFNAHVDPQQPTYVDFPPEMGAPPGTCAKLLRHMYGTRKAAEGWQEEYACTLRELGFTQGRASPCIFHHKGRGLTTSVHGDDFTTAGPKNHLDWFESSMKKAYELKVGGRLGPGPRDDKEATVLNRVIRWTSAGLEYEADPRQVERLLAEVELEGANGASTPGVKTLEHQIAEERELPPSQHTRFRGWAARANYLAADRPDAMYAAKEVCRYMAKPTNLAMMALKRLCRYLRARPRLVFAYPRQTADSLDAYSDTDWAGCPRTRKSTSGGCLMIGSHILKCWSSTQASIALSSGEAEFYGVVRAAGIALGHKSILADLGVDLSARVWTDSSAAMGTCGRQGLGKLRHIECYTLWVQQRLRQGQFELRKVRGDVNPADLFTKHLESRQKVDQLVSLFGFAFREGRPNAAPALRREGLGADSPDASWEEGGLFNTEQPMPDPDMLPHMHAKEELAGLFPKLQPVPRGAFGEADPEGNEPELRDPFPPDTVVRVHRPHKLLAPRRDENHTADAAGLVTTDCVCDETTRDYNNGDATIRDYNDGGDSSMGSSTVGSIGAPTHTTAGACRTRARARTRGPYNPARCTCCSGSDSGSIITAGTQLGTPIGIATTTTNPADIPTAVLFPTTGTTTTTPTTIDCDHNHYYSSMLATAAADARRGAQRLLPGDFSRRGHAGLRGRRLCICVHYWGCWSRGWGCGSSIAASALALRLQGTHLLHLG